MSWLKCAGTRLARVWRVHMKFQQDVIAAVIETCVIRNYPESSNFSPIPNHPAII
jgi:hypothetical protein